MRNIRKKILKLGVTWTDFSKSAGVCITTLKKADRGEKVSPLTEVRIARALRDLQQKQAS